MTVQATKQRYIDWIFILAVLFLLVYIILRSLFVPILHDEVATFLLYIETGNFLPKNAWPDANNHILNSALSRITYLLFGHQPWSLRLPNVLSFIIYCIAIIGISKSLKNKWLQVVFVAVLLFTHGFVEFFALCRGYGLSMAFLMLSLWMIMLWRRKNKMFYSGFAILSLILAFAANLNLLPSAGLIVFYILVFWFSKMKSFKINSHIFPAVSLIMFIIFYINAFKYSMILKDMDLLYYGGETGFWNAVLKTNVKLLFFSENQLLIISLVTIFTVTSAFFMYQLFKDKFRKWKEPEFTLFPFLLFGSLGAIFFLHFVLNINYPEDRTSMFLYPYLIGFTFFTFDHFKVRIIKWVSMVFLIIPLHFFIHINTAYSFHWHYERIPTEFAQMVFETNDNENPDFVTMSGYKTHALTWGYYVRFFYPGVPLINTKNYPNNMDDFILIRKQETDTMKGYFHEYNILARDPYSHNMLMKRKKSCQKKLLFEKDVFTEPITTENEYINFFPDTIFDFQKKSLIFHFNIEYSPECNTKGSVIVVSVRDSTNQNLIYQATETDWMGKPQNNTFSFAVSLLNIPAESEGLIAYLWNKNTQLLTIEKASVRVFEITE